MIKNYCGILIVLIATMGLGACQDRRDPDRTNDSEYNTPPENTVHNDRTGSTTIENVTPNPDTQRNVSEAEIIDNNSTTTPETSPPTNRQ